MDMSDLLLYVPITSNPTVPYEAAVEQTRDSWHINHDEDLHESQSRVAQRQLFPMHTACWKILVACWDNSIATFPLDLQILADFLISQPRGWQLPHILEGNWVSMGLKLTTGDYTRYRDPEDYSRVETALSRLTFPDDCPFLQAKTRSLLSRGKPDRFSLLPVELRLMILCFLPMSSVETIRQVSGGMALVPLEGTFWLSRLSEPNFCHLPKHIARSTRQESGQTPQWLLAMVDEKIQNRNRQRIIQYNNLLVERILQRRGYLNDSKTLHRPPQSYYRPLIECIDEPHPAYEKSERTLTWFATVHLGPQMPFSSVTSLTATYTGSYGGKYLSGLLLETPSRTLSLGFCDPDTKNTVQLNGRSPHKNNILLQSDSRGIFEISVVNQQTLQYRKHGKIVLNPTTMGSVVGFQAELSLVCFSTD